MDFLLTHVTMDFLLTQFTMDVLQSSASPFPMLAQLGLCVPDSCSAMELTKVINEGWCLMFCFGGFLGGWGWGKGGGGEGQR